jgi:hypothetical protein
VGEATNSLTRTQHSSNPGEGGYGPANPQAGTLNLSARAGEEIWVPPARMFELGSSLPPPPPPPSPRATTPTVRRNGSGGTLPPPRGNRSWGQHLQGLQELAERLLHPGLRAPDASRRTSQAANIQQAAIEAARRRAQEDRREQREQRMLAARRASADLPLLPPSYEEAMRQLPIMAPPPPPRPRPIRPLLPAPPPLPLRADEMEEASRGDVNVNVNFHGARPRTQ